MVGVSAVFSVRVVLGVGIVVGACCEVVVVGSGGFGGGYGGGVGGGCGGGNLVLITAVFLSLWRASYQKSRYFNLGGGL